MSLFNLLSVSASGMSAQRKRAEVLVENLANAETTRTPEGGPYKRKDVVFETAATDGPFANVFQMQLSGSSQMGGAQMQGVRVAEVVQDQREPDMRYQPGHPDADKDGYGADGALAAGRAPRAGDWKVASAAPRHGNSAAAPVSTTATARTRARKSRIVMGMG